MPDKPNLTSYTATLGGCHFPLPLSYIELLALLQTHISCAAYMPSTLLPNRVLYSYYNLEPKSSLLTKSTPQPYNWACKCSLNKI